MAAADSLIGEALTTSPYKEMEENYGFAMRSACAAMMILNYYIQEFGIPNAGTRDALLKLNEYNSKGPPFPLCSSSPVPADAPLGGSVASPQPEAGQS